MKLLLGLSVPFLLSASAALAIVGGPFGNEELPDFATGTWQGVLSGKNLTGVVIFGTSSRSTAPPPSTTTSSAFSFFTGATSTTTTQQTAGGLGTSGSEGRVAVFVDGLTVIGQVTSSVDFEARKIASVFEASRLRNIQPITREVNTSTLTFRAGTPATRDAQGNILQPAQPPVTTETLTTANEPFTLNDVLNLNGAYDAKITEAFPTSKFEGTGKVTISEAQSVREVQIGPIRTRNIGILGLQQVQTRTTSVIPEIVSREESFKIRGVRTSFFTPVFGSTVQVQQSTVTSGAGGGGGGGAAPGGGGGGGAAPAP